MKIPTFIKPISWVWLIAILYLSLKPNAQMPLDFEYVDKLLHFMAYGLATILTLMAYPNLDKYKLIALLFTYSFLLEIAQLFAKNRLFELADLAANLTGILLSVLLFGFIKSRLLINQ